MINLTDAGGSVHRAVEQFGAMCLSDNVTDNLIVLLGDRGFAISRHWLAENDPKVTAEVAASVVRDIIAGKSESTHELFVTPMKIRSRRELLYRGLTAVFDPQ